MMREKYLRGFVSSKGADQPVHLCSLINPFGLSDTLKTGFVVTRPLFEPAHTILVLVP